MTQHKDIEAAPVSRRAMLKMRHKRRLSVVPMPKRISVPFASIPAGRNFHQFFLFVSTKRTGDVQKRRV